MDDNTRLEDLEQLYQAAKAWRRNLSDVLGSVKLSDGVESLMARSEHTVSTFEALRDTIDRLMGKEVNEDKLDDLEFVVIEKTRLKVLFEVIAAAQQWRNGMIDKIGYADTATEIQKRVQKNNEDHLQLTLAIDKLAEVGFREYMVPSKYIKSC